MSQFFVKLPSNRTLVFNSSLYKTILDIKSEICNREGIPINIQKLYLSQRPLDNNIASNIIINNHTVSLYLPIVGGGIKGATHMRRKNNQNAKRELVFKKHGESDYGQVKAVKGDKRAIVLCLSDGKEYLCRIAGSLHQWIMKEDIVLIGLRDFEKDKADIVWRYTPEESRKLMRAGEIQNSIRINEQTFDKNSSTVDFIDANGIDDDEDEDMVQQNRYDMPPSDSENEEDMINGI
jgi:translation initiation factor 1A